LVAQQRCRVRSIRPPARGTQMFSRLRSLDGQDQPRSGYRLRRGTATLIFCRRSPVGARGKGIDVGWVESSRATTIRAGRWWASKTRLTLRILTHPRAPTGERLPIFPAPNPQYKAISVPD